MTALAVLVLSGGARLWSLYAFALVFGVADAFFFPAQNAIVPALVDESRLQQANGIVQGTGQLAVFVGPALAGVVVAGLDTAGAGHDSRGMAVALLFDAATFLVSLGTLALIRGGGDGTGDERTIPEAIREGLAFVWRSPTIRFAVLVVMAINALIVGPFDVGVPVLAYARLPQGAAAFGTLMSALGGGSLAGMLAAAALPKVRPAAFGRVVMGVLSLAGLGLAGLSQVHSLAPAIAVTAVIGLATGYGNLMLITWAQQRIPAVMMGRVISLVGLVTMGLVPVSQVVAGAAVRFGLSAMLLVAGGAMAAVAAASLLAPRVRDMGREPTIGAVAAERPSVEAS